MSAEAILQMLSTRGPQVPTQIAQSLGTNSIIASAHLSELKARGKIKISALKVGSSPLYFLPGQEKQLQDFADNLHDKEKQAYDTLEKKKIIRDIEQEPVLRVALRRIKDFAIPLEVQRGVHQELFWKWFLLSAEEAQDKINAMLGTANEQSPGNPSVTPPERTLPEKDNIPEPKPSEASHKKKRRISKEHSPQQKLDAPKLSVKTKSTDVEFMGVIDGFFSSSNISVLDMEILKKTEVDYRVKVPSAVGEMEYYCKTRKKMSINDADLASAFAQGQVRKLPVLFLTTGKLTKRAREMLEKDFKGMQVREL